MVAFVSRNMFNLLPKAKKEIIRREYRMRLAVVCLLFLLAVFIISSLLLLPSLFLSGAKERAAQERFAALLESGDQTSAADLDAALANTAARIALLKSEAPTTLLLELLTLIVSVKSDRISLTDISIGAPAEGKRDLRLGGIARDRSALLSFIRALEQTRMFETVESPISNFAKDADITFEVRARGAF